jgi:hypothetical protein
MNAFRGQGLPDGINILIPKTPNLDSFWRALEWKKLVYFMDICNILRPLDVFYGY